MEETIRLECVRLAEDIGESLVRSATQAADGSISWGRGYGRKLEPAVDAGVFNGRIGDALFLAALFTVTENPAFRSAAERASATMLVHSGEQDAVRELTRGIGFGLSGIGGILYGLTTIGRLLNDESYNAAAARIAGGISADLLRRDRRYELFWGLAGTLLGCLSVRDQGGNASRVSRECADILLDARQDEYSGVPVWRLAGREGASSSLSHGTAGIGLAFMRAYSRLGDTRYYSAAIAAYEYDRLLYDEGVGNWNETPKSAVTMTSWCHGATGIGFARLASLPLFRPDDVNIYTRDIYLAAKRTATLPLASSDTLCCGSLGHFEFLHEAGRRLQSEAIEAQAKDLLRAILARARRRGFQFGQGNEPHHQRGALWQGASGVGYTLLRAAGTTELPCILMLDWAPTGDSSGAHAGDPQAI